MGGLLSGLFGWSSEPQDLEKNLGPDADTPNPDTGLTPRDIFHINRTWNLVKPNIREHGVKFFLLFFKSYPPAQSRFNAFKDVPLEELKNNKRLAAHGTTVLSAIDSYVQNLDDPSCVVEMLQTAGKNHKSRGISKENFEALPPVLMNYLQEGLGSHWTETAESAWNKLLGIVTSVMVQQL